MKSDTRNAFTLIELIAAIVIIAVLSLFATPIIINLIKSNKQKSYDAKIALILRQAKQYARNNDEFLYSSDKRYFDYVCNKITVTQLYEAGYLKELSSSDGSIQNITNPKDGSTLGNVGINVYIKSSNRVGNDLYVGNIISNFNAKECVSLNHIYNFDYTGTIQSLPITESGEYKLEVWGAEAGTAKYGDYVYAGGTGAYSQGRIYLKAGETLYVGVGGKGTSVTGLVGTYSFDNGTGYNGGTKASYQYYNASGHNGGGSFSGGGGATHIALRNGLLKDLSSNVEDILIVAGGGGGSFSDIRYDVNSGWGGDAGGSSSGIARIKTDLYGYTSFATGATQSSPGYLFHGDHWQFTHTFYNNANEPYPSQDSMFGQGGGYLQNQLNLNGAVPVSVFAGGGGGFYGGGTGYIGPGGGGSSYIGNNRLYSKRIYCYNCPESTLEDGYTLISKCSRDQFENDCVKLGDGHARITYYGPAEDPEVPYQKVYVNNNQTEQFVAPYTGKYRLDVWDAQGGSSFKYLDYNGGNGGYSTGVIELNENDVLYVNVGGAGKDFIAGYNGGGTGKYACSNNVSGGGGGGASSIAFRDGLLSDLADHQEDIIIVAGGGGGAGLTYAGGSGGGYMGTNGAAANASVSHAGGTQDSGYAFGQGESPTVCKDNYGLGAGGGGFYGGYASQASNDNGVSSGGGGSGYLNTSLLTDAQMYCYNCSGSTEYKTTSTTCAQDVPTRNCAKKFGGYVKITYLGL